MTPVPILCSRNAHDQNVLVRRPQEDQHGCHSKREKRASLEGSFCISIDRFLIWRLHQATEGVPMRKCIFIILILAFCPLHFITKLV